MVMKTRGQLKIQQMAIMLLAVTLFFVLVGMFVLVFKVSDLKQQATIIQEDNAKLLVSKIADSPEFSCGDSFGTGLSSCIDADKVLNLENIISKYGYGSFWGVQGLQIRKIFPSNNTNIECSSGNFPNCDTITLVPSSNSTGISNFVSLCWVDSSNSLPYGRCALAEIIVSYSGVS